MNNIITELPNEIYIAGVTKIKRKTFTGNVLFKNEIGVAPNGYSHDDSIETSWEDAKIVDGVVVWRSNGQIPFADMLLDFVQIGKITLGQAHMSAEQKDIEQSAALDHLMVNARGEVCLGAEAFEDYEARADK